MTAKNYVCAAPKQDVPLFRQHLPASIDVVDEREFSGEWDLRRIAELLPDAMAWRAGWYLQQFVKISAALQHGTTLIWDADTVPLNRLDFREGETEIIFYHGREHHQPYFDTIDRLLGIQKTISRSFIAQCMCVRSNWVGDLISTLEKRHGRSWIEAIMSALPGNGPCEFSEYETIGTFVCQSFPGSISFTNRRWSRFGTRLVGEPGELVSHKAAYLGRAYDFIAFEKTAQRELAIKVIGEHLRAAWHYGLALHYPPFPER